MTFKGGKTDKTYGQGYRLYKLMNGIFNLLTDNPSVAATDISHVSVWATYSGGTTNVPDFGRSSLLCLGLGALGFIKRRK